MTSPLLRRWSTDDAPALLAAVAGAPDLVTQFPVADLTDEAACAAFIARALTVDADRANLAITLDGVAVGNAGISAIEHRHGTGWVHYWLAPAARGRGLASAAVAAVAHLALTTHGLHRLELGHRVNNPASCAVATRAGFVAEGIERQKLSYDGVRYDVETHARLRSDPAPSGPTLAVADGAW